MPAKIRKVPKIHKSDDAEVKAVHISYFTSIGAPDGLVFKHGTPAWTADFQIRFGRPEYRKRAWEDVREDVRERIPHKVYERLDTYYTDGPALHFTYAFDFETREKMLEAVQKMNRSRKGDTICQRR